MFVSAAANPFHELAPGGGQALVGARVYGARDFNSWQLTRLHTSARFDRLRNCYAKFEVEFICAHFQMMREDRTFRLDTLPCEHCHQFTSSGAKSLHHVGARNSQMDNRGWL